MHDIAGDLNFSIMLMLGFLFLIFLLFLSVSLSINEFEKKLRVFSEILNKRYDMERKINEQYPDLNLEKKEQNA